MRRLRQILIMTLVLVSSAAMAQQTNRFEELRKTLESMKASQPGLSEKVELSVSNASIQEFVRGMASVNKLNISVDPTIKATVANNFSNATASDVLLFLVRQYNLEIDFIGSIIHLKPYKEPAPIPIPYQPKQLAISYNKTTDFLSFDLKNDSLANVLKAVTNQSLKNVIPAPGLENQLVSAYIKNRPFDNALEKMAFANGLAMDKTEDGFYVIKKAETQVAQNSGDPSQTGQSRTRRRGTAGASNNRRTGSGGAEGLSIEIAADSLLTVNAVDVPLSEVVQEVSNELLKNYFLFNQPEGNTTLFVENVSYEEFLSYALNGTDYTYKLEDKVYLIGERNLEGLRTTEMVQMQNRPVESIVEYIPQELQAGVDIQEYLELNSLIMSGSHPQIQELKKFINDVDKVVPVVMIDVIIVDVDRTNIMSTGINASFGSGEPGSTTGSVGTSAGGQFQLNSSTLNNLIDQFNGFGILNLGKVAPDFQASLNALETASVVKKRSTPRLSTINGHEASMSIGETEYYLETQNNVVGNSSVSQNLLTQSGQYRSINADLSIIIKPIVSGDNQVTLDIKVEESSFTSRISATAPPGMRTTSFSSKVRVKNEEMLLMGGLEQNDKSNTTEGLPFVARVPVLRFFFSQRTRSATKAKLHVFIKPTIIY